MTHLEENQPSTLRMVSLRCKSCSAPLSVKPTDDIVKCEYCGSAQKMVDARLFFDQILAQVNAWVRQAMPPGIGSSVNNIVDPIARHMVFTNNVQPRLTTEYGEYRFSCLNILSHPLLVLPYMTDNTVVTKDNPKEVFLFQAKTQSIQALAVDDESKSLLSEIGGLSTAYAYLLNNISLMAELKLERYYFMRQNLEAAADALKDVAKYEGLHERVKGAAALAHGLDLLTSLRPVEASPHFEMSRELLEQAEATVSQNPEMAIMLQAIKMERSMSNSARYLAEAAAMSRDGDVAEGMIPIRNLLNTLGSIKNDGPAFWRTRFQNAAHNEQILKIVADIRRATSHSGTLAMIPGSGTVLYPFWAVDIPYTFQTGALWRTQGVEVVESVLVSATFPMDRAAFYEENPRSVITDVFSARERRGFFEDSFKKISGKETSISGGGPIREAIQKAQPGYPTGMKVVPPLSTAQDSISVVQSYVAKAGQADRAIQNQLRLSSPRVVGLLFAPGAPDGSRPNVMPWLGGLAPSSVGNLEALSAISL